MMGTCELDPTSRSVTLSVPSWPWAAPPQSLLGSLRPCDTPAFTGLSPPHGALDTACKSLDLNLKEKRHTGPTCVCCFPPLTCLCCCC